ncbi:MAG: hypothetical protein ACOYNS_02170 [Bacteroidota bacterium]
MTKRTSFLTAILSMLLVCQLLDAQINVDGDFRMRWYSDSFGWTRDGRAQENYMRYLGRLRAKAKVTSNTSFNTELITLIDNPGQPVRNIAGTGPMRFGISQIYAEMSEQDVLMFDLARIRVGRQQFPIANGLSFGDSYYYTDKFDGGRLDLALFPVTLSLFGAITGQNLSSSGLYPDPGSDQIYVAKLGGTFFDQDLTVYGIQQKLRGAYNDNIVVGAGAAGELLFNNLEYFAEGAMQKFNQAPGLPEKGGIGYLGGIGYRWGMGPFRSIKVETRYAAYQGDDAKTKKIEQFSPPFPNFFWGSRVGYVNGDVGGDYPRNGQNLEGSRIWYSRIYVIPKMMPKVRLQLQYISVNEYVDNDNYNSMDDEISVRIYYTVTNNSAFQLRFARSIPNGDDKDRDGGGVITSSEDRVSVNSYMVEWQIEF